MLVVGERINSTRTRVQEAIKGRDASYILNEARAQLKAGADFIDVNCAVTSGDELQDIEWVISVMQAEISDVSLCIDSPNYLAIERGLKVCNGQGGLMINSITGERERIERIMPYAIKYKTKLVALTLDENGMPDTAEDRVRIAEKIIGFVRKEGFDPGNLYFDPLIRPIATEPKQAKEFLGSINLIKKLGVKIICGLSNISFGLPDRKLINAVFLSMAIQAGLDAAILDPTDKIMNSSLKASKALLGMDEYCAGYIKAFREGGLI